MSRSFYVDSLIVKDAPTTAVSKSDCVPNHSLGMPLPVGHRHPTSTARLPQVSQSLPCYPRHPQDMLSFCCPLCVHTPHPVVPESVASVPGMVPSFTTSCPTTRPMVDYPFHRRQISVLTTTTKSIKRPKDRVTSPGLQEHRKPKASSAGKIRLEQDTKGNTGNCMIYNSFTVKNLNVAKKKNFNNLFNGLLLKVYQMELKISEVISLLYLLRLVRNYFLNVISTFLCFRGE